MTRSLVFALGIVVAAAGLAACGTEKSTKDAAVTACTPDPEGDEPTASGTVKNTSSETSTFAMRIGFYDTSDNRVSEGVVTVSDVEPNATAQWATTGVGAANGPLTCKIMSLNRTSVLD